MLEVDRARAPFIVEAVEAPRKARFGALTLDLRLDRVDRLADGSLAVIDYKTGANAEIRAWLDERPKLPRCRPTCRQLGPEQVGAVAFARLRSGDTGYVGVARADDAFPGLKVPGTRGWPRDYDRVSNCSAAWQRRLEALAAEYAAGDATGAGTGQACEYCHLGALCRIAETSAVKPGEESDDE